MNTLIELQNMQTMINCNKKEFRAIIKNAIGKIFMTSGSWYTPFELYDELSLLAKYESNGKLIYKRS